MSTTEQILIQPAQGLVVVDPGNGKPLPADGALVASSPYWLRRLSEGDVVLVPQPAAEPEAPIEAPAEAPSKTARNK